MIHSFKVATTLAAQRIVGALSGTAQAVGYPESNRALPLGITKDTVKDVTQSIPVACAGEIAKLYFNGSCATGGLVQSDSSGRGVEFTLPATSTASTLPSAIVGILVGPTVATTGTVADVLIMPSYERGSV